MGMRIFNRMVSIALLTTILMLCSLIISCDNRKPPMRPRSMPAVATITMKAQKVVLTDELPGRASAYRIAEIRPQVSGLILKRFFIEGSDVKAGQILYQIDPAPFQAVYDNAVARLNVMKKSANQAQAAFEAAMANVTQQKATMKLAMADQKRFEDAFKDRAVSESQRDKAVTNASVARATLRAVEAQMESSREAVAVAKANIRQAEALVKTARINLEYCRITAPIAGRIGRSNVTEGAIVTAYQPLALSSIQQLDPIYVDVPQSTTDLLQLKRRMKNGHINHDGIDQDRVKLILEDNTEYPLEGVLKFSDVSVDPTTGSVILRLVFPNPGSVLLPGMFVNAVIKEGVNEKAILVPQQGVSRDHKGNPFAMVVGEKNRVGIRMLAIDRALGNKWLVSKGLVPGDRVIVEGLQMLRPGTIVKATPFVANKRGINNRSGMGHKPELNRKPASKNAPGNKSNNRSGTDRAKKPEKKIKGGA